MSDTATPSARLLARLRDTLGPVAQVTGRAGGPLGRHRATAARSAGGEPRLASGVTFAAIPVFAWSTLTWLVLMLRQVPCLRGLDQYKWMCYSDIGILYQVRDQATGSALYFDIDWEYPVLSGYFAEFARRITDLLGFTAGPDVDGAAQAANAHVYFAVNAILLFACFLVIVAVQRRMSVTHPWAVMAVAVSPAVMATGIVNWDLFAIMLTALGLYAHARGKWWQAGVWLGLAVAAKFYPLVILGGLFALALRPFLRSVLFPQSDGDDPAGALAAIVNFLKLLLAAGAAWLLANLPVMLYDFDRFAYFYTFNQGRPADLGSPWYAFTSAGFSLPNAQAWALGLMFLGYAAIALLIVLAPVRPRPGQVAFLCVALMVSLNTVYSPQYVLWTLPLVVLARPVLGDLVAWTVAELGYYAAVWTFLDWFQFGVARWPITPTAVGSAGSLAYSLAIFARIGVTWWIMAVVARDIWWPRHDPCRAEREGLAPVAGLGATGSGVTRFAGLAGAVRGLVRPRSGAPRPTAARPAYRLARHSIDGPVRYQARPTAVTAPPAPTEPAPAPVEPQATAAAVAEKPAPVVTKPKKKGKGGHAVRRPPVPAATVKAAKAGPGSRPAAPAAAQPDRRRTATAAVAPTRVTAPGRARPLFQPAAAPLVAVVGFLASRLTLLFSALAVAKTTDGLSGLDATVRWDAFLYSAIADSGYTAEAGANTAALVPGLPLLLRLCHAVGVSTAVGGYVIALAGSALAAWALYRLGRGGVAGAVAVVAWSFAPVAIFADVPYAEAPFAACAFWAWAKAREGKWWTAGALAAGACCFRLSGAFLVAGLIVMALLGAARGDDAGLRTRGAAARGAAQRLAGLSPVLLPAIAWGVYQKAHFGSWSATLAAQQAGYFRQFAWPWRAWTTTIQSVQNQPDNSWIYIGETVAVVAAVAVGALLVWRFSLAQGVYVGLQGVAYACQTWFYTAARSSLLWFP
ncbi:MAG: hypothetical protein LBR33_12745, partial [Propionibacteriaceae bacterium]|nr:hypothetical protein [Propionibacteriaceae bacterium]